ncbi:hypothetical protein OG211_14295 [Streptomyces niveus]|uniref:ATP-binding protein n=1 Tax=Streptomyces niveus TaxID=193462 RepID=A0ABZ2A7D1_STRNV|nr:hypothetical protein [Streptomyces niveus]WTA59558.1 hypothetical protein OG211_14295 [Streptomyces niveus]
MKPTKVAAVVAGSVLALGAAAPAFAGQNLPMSLNGGLGQAAETVTNQERLDPTVVNTNALDPKNDGSLVNSLGDVAKGLNGGAKGGAKGKGTHGKGGKGAKGGQSGKGGAMLGGIPLGK